MSMPQLVEGQSARLDVGVSLPCRVIGFSGPDVVLALLAAPPDTLAAGDEGYLLVDSGNTLQAVRGRIATPGEGELVLRLSEEIRLGQRRLFSRAPITLPAVLKCGGRTFPTLTRDVSAGGVRLARPPAAHPGPEAHEVEIRAADHRIAATAVVIRATARDLAMEFASIERDDRLLLAALTLAYHRRA